MAMKVMGKRTGSFKDKDNGKEVAFGKLYVNYEDSTVTGVQGTIAEAISVKPELLEKIPIGSDVTLIYNKYGKVDDFMLKNAAKTA
jgi:hypothetical protein